MRFENVVSFHFSVMLYRNRFFLLKLLKNKALLSNLNPHALLNLIVNRLKLIW